MHPSNGLYHCHCYNRRCTCLINNECRIYHFPWGSLKFIFLIYNPKVIITSFCQGCLNRCWWGHNRSRSDCPKSREYHERCSLICRTTWLFSWCDKVEHIHIGGCGIWDRSSSSMSNQRSTREVTFGILCNENCRISHYLRSCSLRQLCMVHPLLSSSTKCKFKGETVRSSKLLRGCYLGLGLGLEG